LLQIERPNGRLGLEDFFPKVFLFPNPVYTAFISKWHLGSVARLKFRWVKEQRVAAFTGHPFVENPLLHWFLGCEVSRRDIHYCMDLG